MSEPTFTQARDFFEKRAQADIKAQQQATFRQFAKANAKSGNRGQRDHPLGEMQSGHAVMGKQYYDVRYNVDACRNIILYWNRNAYSSDAPPHGYGPIEIKHINLTYVAYCHVDITTPRENMLWHGVQGPHIVIERFQKKGDATKTFQANEKSLWLSPENIISLSIHFNKCKKAGVAPNQSGGNVKPWPEWFLKKIADNLFKLPSIPTFGNEGEGEDYTYDLFP